MKHISAYDPTIRKRVIFVVNNGIAVSLATGYKFNYPIKRSDNQ